MNINSWFCIQTAFAIRSINEYSKLTGNNAFVKFVVDIKRMIKLHLTFNSIVKIKPANLELD